MQRFMNRGLFLVGMLTLAGSLPVITQAQERPAETSRNRLLQNTLITLNLESNDLYAAFKMLFQQAKVDYTLDESLRGTRVTVSIRQPFRIAVETLIRASGLPLTLIMENDVYSIVPRKETGTEPLVVEDEKPEAPPARTRIVRFSVHNISALDIVSMLGGRIIPFSAGFTTWSVNPFAGMFGPGGFGGLNGGNAGNAASGQGQNRAGGTAGNGGVAGGLLSGTGPVNIYAYDGDNGVFGYTGP